MVGGSVSKLATSEVNWIKKLKTEELFKYAGCGMNE
jgi:hypothetical protein